MSGMGFLPAKAHREITITYANVRARLKYACVLRRCARARSSHVPSPRRDDRSRGGERPVCGDALRSRDARQRNDDGRWKNVWPW